MWTYKIYSNLTMFMYSYVVVLYNIFNINVFEMYISYGAKTADVKCAIHICALSSIFSVLFFFT